MAEDSDSDLRPYDGRSREPWGRSRTWPKIPIFGLVTDEVVNHGYKLEGGLCGISGHMAQGRVLRVVRCVVSHRAEDR
ncbi:MAG TPA: hypothetical protein VMT00_15455, partial [Thermoanaerobaculia bacterium]|nr:hypothetical protein [Thermoanaerobaculia bacterium]